MLTGMYAARNLLLGEANDLWSVNTEQEYHEEVLSPEVQAVEDAFVRVFAKLDRRAFGLALGTVTGLGLFLATIFLVVKGGAHVGSHLELLDQYFPGYRVTPTGSILGLVYGFVLGFSVGSSFAIIRNAIFFVYEFVIRRRMESGILRRFIDYI